MTQEKKLHQPSVLVLSFSSLLGSSLATRLESHSLEVTYLDLGPDQFGLDKLPSLKPDFICLLYPSQSNLSQLTPILDFLQQASTKTLVLDYYQTHFLDNHHFPLPDSLLRLVYLTDCYGPTQYAAPSSAQNLIAQSTTKAKLLLKNQGQNPTFPTHVDDLLAPILNILFSSGSSHPIYWLSTLDQVTEIDLVVLLKKYSEEILGRRIELELAPASDQMTAPEHSQIAKTQALLNWQPSIEIEEGIRNLFQAQAKQKKTTVSQPKPDQSAPPSTFNKKRQHLAQLLRRINKKTRLTAVIIATSALLTLLAPGLLLLASLSAGSTLAKAVTALETGQSQKAGSRARRAQALFTYSRRLLDLNRHLFFFLPATTLTKHERLLDAGSRFSQVVLTTTNSAEQANILYRSLLGVGQADNNLLPSLRANLANLHTELSLIETSLKDLDFSSRLPYLGPLKASRDKLPDLRARLELGLTLLDLLPLTAGQPQTTKYLVLLQNNHELRPTGGFLSAYGILSLQNNHLLDFTTANFYTADAQLSGHVDPPPPLDRYLSQDWYARDANWHPNFSEASQQVQWFLSKEIGQSFQGTITLDLYALKLLLTATGPLNDPSLGEIITADNLFEVVNRRSQIDFTTSNPTGQDFLPTLLQLVVNQIRTTKPSLAQLAKAIDLGLGQLSILLSFNSPEVQNLIASQNWAASLQHPACPTQFSDVPCANETFALIEANLGINRSNYFLNRQMSQRVTISPQGEIDHLISVLYQNTSPGPQWPGGHYKTYTRFYFPLNSRVLQIKLDDQLLTPEFITDRPNPNPNLQSLGFYYEVPAGSNKTLTISLASRNILSTLTPATSLSLNWEKQPGLPSTPLHLKLHFPDFLKPRLISYPANTQDSQLELSLPLITDTNFSVKFTK